MSVSSSFDDLERRVAADGVDRVLDELHSARTAVPAKRDLAELVRVLDLEAHHLRGWDRAARPGLLAQQVLGRAHAVRAGGLAVAAREWIDEVGHLVLVARWRTQAPSVALLRSLARGTGRSPGIVGLASGPGGLVYSVDGDAAVQVWDVATGRHRRSLAVQDGRPTSVAVSPDGTVLAVGLSNSTVQLLGLVDDTVSCSLHGHTERVTRVRFLPDDSNRLVSASEDATLRLWDVAGGRSLRTYSGHTGSVTAVTLGSDGRMLMSGSLDGTVRVWEVGSEACRQVVGVDDGAVLAVALADADTVLVVGTLRGGVHRYDVEDGTVRSGDRLEPRRPARSGWGPAWDVATAGDGRILVCCDDAMIDVWAGRPPDHQGVLVGHGSVVRTAVVERDGRTAVSGDNGGLLLVWDLLVDATTEPRFGLNRGVARIAVAPGGDLVVSSAQASTRIVAREVPTGAERWRADENGVGPSFLWFSAAGSTLYAADGRRVAHRSADSGRVEEWVDMPGHVACGSGGYAVTVREVYPSTGQEAYELAVADVTTGAVLRRLAFGAEAGYPGHAAVTADGQVVVAGTDTSLIAWLPETGRTGILPFPAPPASEGPPAGRVVIFDIGLDAEGCHAVCGDSSGRVSIWDLDTGRLSIVQTDDEQIHGVAGLPGHRAVTVAASGSASVWDLTRGEVICAAPVDGRLVAVAAAGADIVVGDTVGNVHCLELFRGGVIPPAASTAAPLTTAPAAAAPPTVVPGETRRPSLLRRLLSPRREDAPLRRDTYDE